MWFIDSIFSLVWDISDWFWNLAISIPDWLDPYQWFSTPLFWISDLFWSLLTPIAQFGDWTWDVYYQLQNMITESRIFSLLQTWLNYAEWAWDWVSNAWYYVWNMIEDWWAGVEWQVRMWIQDAQDWVLMLVYDVQTWLNTLQRNWDNFKGMIPSISEIVSWFGDWWARILAPLTDWWNERLLDAQGLIDSTLRTWFPFYNQLTALWSSIALFFTDPEEWLYKAVDRIIERFW
jgi:hypothetical protein